MTGQYSIRTNSQWHICFTWINNNAEGVEICDSTKDFAPVHPGEVLAEDFLAGFNISQYRLAKDIHVPPRRINEIVKGKRGITADTALRLGRYFGGNPRILDEPAIQVRVGSDEGQIHRR